MKLFIYDKFWDSFIGISKDAQKKTAEFMSKFRQNSKSSGINLEKINTFKDESLRTARIDKKYRAVLKEVDPGNIYLLVWIDNHDEAMNWAANKIIEWNENTDSYQVFEIDEETSAVSDEKNKTEEVLFYGQFGEKDLIKIGVPKILMSSVLQIQNLSELEKMEEYLPADAFENLFHLADGANIDSLITEIQDGKAESKAQEALLKSKNNHRSFIELTDDEMFNEALQGSLKKWKYYLHPSQAELVNRDFKESVKVSGGAGTGKTVAALHRLKYLSENKRTDQPILFTTFTKELTNNLRSLASELKINPGVYKIENIDYLAYNLAKERKLLKSENKVFGLDTGKKPADIWEKVLETELSAFDSEFLEAEFEEVILEQKLQTRQQYFRASRVGRSTPVGRQQRGEIWELVELFKKEKESSSLLYKQEIYNLLQDDLEKKEETLFSHIIVDELQDFSNVELRFIRSLTAVGKNDLFLVGDPLQNIYNRRINFSQLGINIRGNRSKRLRINYRTTEEIKNLAMKVIKGEEFDDFDGENEDKKGYLSLYHGEEPVYKTFKNKTEEYQTVLGEIRELSAEGYRYSDIVVAARTNSAVNDFRNMLYKNDIPFTEKDLLNSSNDGVRLTTFHGIKGLEFKQVFLLNVSENTFPNPPYNIHNLSEEEKQGIIKSEKSLLYVASSRAIERLFITGIGKKSELIH